MGHVDGRESHFLAHLNMSADSEGVKAVVQLRDVDPVKGAERSVPPLSEDVRGNINA